MVKTLKDKLNSTNPEQPGQIPPDDDPQIFNLRTLGWFAAAMLGMIVFILAASALLSGSFRPGLSIVITPVPTVAPPGPRLEVNASQVYQSLRATQQAQLESYGWINRQNGVVHIPIEQAMQILAQGRLPVYQGLVPTATPEAP